MLPVNELKELIIKSLDSDKAEDIAVIDLAGKADFADFVIIASGLSGRHTQALADKLIFSLKHNGVEYINIEGQDTGNWILIDLVSIVVHLFKPEIRAHYALEKIWQTTKRKEEA
jgi:ribosome silencing factor RsfS/YbeB/iojap